MWYVIYNVIYGICDMLGYNMCVVGVSDGWKGGICYWSNGLLSYYPIRHSAHVSLFQLATWIE